MIFRDDGSIVLETDEEVAEFRKMQDLAKSLRDQKKEKAQRVFDAYCDDEFPDGVDPDNPAHDEICGDEMERWRTLVDDLISENLDHRTLGAFIEIVIANEVKARQAIATNGRRLIGEASRRKVANAAGPFKHLSKEKAAAEIAKIVNLDTGTVRRYLSELFPGDKWKP